MSLRPMDSEFKRRLSPSIALLVVAALTPAGHEVSIEDENTQPLGLGDRPDLVGITVNVDTSARAYEIAAAYRARGIPVVLGGIHPSAFPEEAEQHADAVCIGEAEEVWGRILGDAQARRLQNRYYNGRPTNLAKTPMPRWDLLDRANYLYNNIVCASRGCPFRCEFCYNSADYVHQGYRTRPIRHVVEEIQRLGTRHVMFVDDNLIGNPRWTRTFVRAIRPLGLKWNAAVSANIGAFPNLLDEMKESGCQSLFIGFETINQDAIRSVRKHQNHVDTYERLIHDLHRRGIMVNASLVFGFDHDGPDVFRQTLDWLLRNRVETMTAHILTPYPGTALFRRLLAEGRITDLDWGHYNTSRVVYAPKLMTAEELREGYLWIYRRFYSLRNILRRMPQDREQRLPFLLFNLGYRKFGRVASWVAQRGLMSRVGRLARRLSYGIA
jgi:radical SAM superfamily enzyme YgiQ (UPF0313 family)